MLIFRFADIFFRQLKLFLVLFYIVSAVFILWFIFIYIGLLPTDDGEKYISSSVFKNFFLICLESRFKVKALISWIDHAGVHCYRTYWNHHSYFTTHFFFIKTSMKHKQIDTYLLCFEIKAVKGKKNLRHFMKNIAKKSGMILNTEKVSPKEFKYGG